MKKYAALILLLIVFVVFVLVFAGVYWWQMSNKAVSSADNKIAFVIPKGNTAMEIADKLKDKKICFKISGEENE